MEITWLGHASFLIEDSKGRKILTDPYDNSIGYKIFEGKADVVTISHHHFDHDYIKNIKGNPEILDKVGLFYACDIPIEGIPSYHDHSKGTKRGENIIFVLEIDGYKICHLGDLGHELSVEDINKIGDIDVLLIPIGGIYTIDAKEASIVSNAINSHIIIPMHYKVPSLSFDLNKIEDFIETMENTERLNSSTLKIEGKLKDRNKVKILEPQNAI
ncbi:MBL fold metallo-hydrolase [Clostridium aestuarii]|uniref:MBL fold metallo-hydrolase n=1 Tax=Clostridium aestuarii TaxID=338193 RepID=A0ABT4D405_9CLOT|nr:MBL fold metallo-hydrolase [Clostridium aestuarii]MCY6484985.1 MBL fold metallo-hydrolase [Clostridium aestuarii]